MTIGVKLLRRDVVFEHHPGHMGVTWKEGRERSFRGFRFNPLDLPENVRPASRWRAYLFENRVPGYVTDDILLEDAVARRGEHVLCKQWRVDGAKIAEIEDRSHPGRRGWYSFAPDLHEDCDNCVTWAINTIIEVLGDVLSPVPTGRIKLAIRMLTERGAQPSA